MEATASPRRNVWPLRLALAATVLLALGGWLYGRQIARDAATAEALADAMTAPRVVFDGRNLEARFALAVEDLAATQGRAAEDVRRALERYASGNLLGRPRQGYAAFLAQLATKRFEMATATIRDLAAAAKTDPKATPPAWRLLTLTAVLEFGRGRTSSAEPLLQQAFELADRADQLDSPPAASLLTAFGAIQLSRSQPAEAEPFLRRAAALLRHAPQADPRDRARVLTHFAQAIAAQGFPEEAEPLCAEALALILDFHRTTGRVDTDEPVLAENYRKLLRERGLADAEIDARLRATR